MPEKLLGHLFLMISEYIGVFFYKNHFDNASKNLDWDISGHTQHSGVFGSAGPLYGIV